MHGMENLSQLPIPLLGWYQTHARDLPWRREVTPYRVWVSEIMLQQTRVAAVVGYFTRFLEAFPTVQALAAAPEDRLMKLWQGLGYYSRARNLQKAARQIVDQFGGTFPADYQALRSLAGVGEYTAAAIASIAFGQPVPAVDGNLLRVAARVMGDGTDITTTQGKRHFTQALQAVIPTDFPGKFNQAMMDLGAMVCLPNGAPLCEECPARDFCRAREEGDGPGPPRPPGEKAPAGGGAGGLSPLPPGEGGPAPPAGPGPAGGAVGVSQRAGPGGGGPGGLGHCGPARLRRDGEAHLHPRGVANDRPAL